MSQETGGRTGAPGEEDRFFDPHAPDLPEQVFGIDTRIILGLGEAAMNMDVIPPKIRNSLSALPDVLRILPLIEKMQFGTGSRQETASDGTAPERAPSFTEAAREKVAAVHEDIKLMASFENPREQFVDELEILAEAARTAATEHRDMRVEYKIVAEPPAGRGLKGFATKAFRKVRRFFGFLSGEPAVNPNITAYDAAVGIDKTVRSLLSDAEATKEKLPFLSGLVSKRVSSDKLPSLNQLAFFTPEILTSLFSALSANKANDELLASVKSNPHEFRFITRYIKTYKGVDLRYVQRVADTILPAVRDIIPTNGPQVGMIFDLASKLLKVKPKKDFSEERQEEPQKGFSEQFSEDEGQSKAKKHGWLRFLSRRHRTA